MSELKPCPFCGGEADFIGDTSTIKCKTCGGAFICTSPLISRLDAKEAWNRRYGDNGTAQIQSDSNCGKEQGN
ncbi:MAG: Lar family restriction alleviation protein [Oscillospiraceae bacterium]